MSGGSRVGCWSRKVFRVEANVRYEVLISPTASFTEQNLAGRLSLMSEGIR